MNNEVNNEIEIVDLSDNDTGVEIGTELSVFELAAVSGGMTCTFKSGRQNKCDEWDVP